MDIPSAVSRGGVDAVPFLAAALTEAIPGGEVHVPAGDYVFEPPQSGAYTGIRLGQPGVRLVGDGPGRTVFRTRDYAAWPKFARLIDIEADDCTVEGIGFELGTSPTFGRPGDGITCISANGLRFRVADLSISGMLGSDDDAGGVGVSCYAPWLGPGVTDTRLNGLIERVHVHDAPGGSGIGVTAQAVTIRDCTLTHVGSTGLQHALYIQAGECVVQGCRIDSPSGHAIHCHMGVPRIDGRGIRLIGNTVLDAPYLGVYDTLLNLPPTENAALPARQPLSRGLVSMGNFYRARPGCVCRGWNLDTPDCTFSGDLYENLGHEGGAVINGQSTRALTVQGCSFLDELAPYVWAHIFCGPGSVITGNRFEVTNKAATQAIAVRSQGQSAICGNVVRVPAAFVGHALSTLADDVVMGNKVLAL